MSQPEQPATAAPYDGATLERIMHEALRRGDVKGVHAALSVMATIDPRRAERLLDTLQNAIAIAQVAGITSDVVEPVRRD